MTVSVLMITFAHERFIAQAIEGVLFQETKFKIELIIADDCSPDSTKEIVQSFIENHPRGNLIKYTKHETNKGMNGNFSWALKQCKGRYVALCEGDDYWIDPFKLQKQVSFLDKNLEYGGVATNSTVKYDNKPDGVFGVRKSRLVRIEDILHGRQFHTATFMFRNNIVLPEGYSKLMAGDTPLFLMVAKKSSVYYMNYISTVYRRGLHGATAGHSKLDSADIKYYNNYLQKILLNVSIEDIKVKKSFSAKIGRYIGGKLEAFYFRVFPNSQRYIFDISTFNPFKRVLFRLGVLK